MLSFRLSTMKTVRFLDTYKNYVFFKNQKRFFFRKNFKVKKYRGINKRQLYQLLLNTRNDQIVLSELRMLQLHTW